MKKILLSLIILMSMAGAFGYLRYKNAEPFVVNNYFTESNNQSTNGVEKNTPKFTYYFTNETSVSDPTVKIGLINIPVEIAFTDEEKERGLSGRKSLDEDKGMLFIFSKSKKYEFWMPNMNFPIDIIWMNKDKQVIDISANASNKFNPENPEIYKPSAPAQFILEVNSGFAAKANIKKGDFAVFLGAID